MKICMFTRVMPAQSKDGMQDHIMLLYEKVLKTSRIMPNIGDIF